jgi:hypothetical protein
MWMPAAVFWAYSGFATPPATCPPTSLPVELPCLPDLHEPEKLTFSATRPLAFCKPGGIPGNGHHCTTGMQSNPGKDFSGNIYSFPACRFFLDSSAIR